MFPSGALSASSTPLVEVHLMRVMRAALWMGMVGGTMLCLGCGYRYYAGPLEPAPRAAPMAEMKIADDGTTTYVQGRLEVSVRPVTDEELNRQFPGHSQSGLTSTNPYTFGNWTDPELGKSPPRFTIFRLRVKNYMYPKMRIDPQKAVIRAKNGRQYKPFNLSQLEEYYLHYVTAYAGNRYSNYRERMGILRSTLYAGDPVFSGQEEEGYIVFPVLHPDVEEIHLHLPDVALRFDVWDEPVEQVSIEYVYKRDVGKVYSEGDTVTSLF